MPLLLALGTNVANHQSGSELLSFERTSYADDVYSDEPALFARDAVYSPRSGGLLKFLLPTLNTAPIAMVPTVVAKLRARPRWQCPTFVRRRFRK